MDRLIATALLACALAGACSRTEPPRRYPLRGQVLAVHPEKQQLTIKHEDIPGFMPGMTMSFEVRPPAGAPKRQASVEPQSAPAGMTTVLLNGAAPTVPAGSFDKRNGWWR